MKRELAFALEAHSELPLCVGRTRASAVQTQRGDLNGVSGDRSSKRFKAAGLNASGTNGGIHASQERLEVNGSVDKSQAKNVKGSQCAVVAVYRRTRTRNANLENGQKVDEIERLETVVDRTEFNLVTECGDENNGVLADSASRKEELRDCCEKSTINEDGSAFVPTAFDENSEVWKTENNGVRNDVTNYGSDEVKCDGLVVAPRRFTRLAWDSNSEVELVECPVYVAAGSEVSGGDENETLLNVEVNEISVANDLGSPTKKLELRMSKKIALGRIPRTVKELFATGLLDGYAVFYNGGNKGSELQGMIKDVGILCFCSLCKGSRVINPSKFEIHACKSYRRAAQYICLENGRSLLEVLKTCRNSPLDILEETIQSVIGPPSPAKESIICQNCKGSFLGTFSSKKVEQLCLSCVGLNNSEATPTYAIDTNSRLSKQVSTQKTCRSASVHILSQNKSQPNITERSAKAVTDPWLSKNSPCLSPQENGKWKITKKDLRLHKLVFEDGGLPDGTEVAYYSKGQRLLEGYKRGLGIICRCCNSKVSPSQFEAHAGWASHKKPYGYIYTSNGVSLHEFAISLLKGGKYSVKENDDLCIICADGGNLLLCDGCPRAFHKECASLSSIPCGKWYCKYCQNLLQKEKFVEHNANAVAAGRVSGADPIEQITKRCIRIVKYPEDAEVIACILCRAYDFSKSGFGPRTVIVCDQCEKEYHVGCLKKHKMADLKELPEGKWFCSIDCQRIYSALQNLLILGEEKIQDSLLDVLKLKQKDRVSDTATDLDVRWRLLSGKIASPHTRPLLSKAVAIFHECFDPIVDSATGRDFIPSMVYGRNIRGQDFGGIYCAVLTVNSSIVSAGIFRVFGLGIAELPLVATSKGNQGKGYFQILYSCIEKLLTFLNVKTLVLPAAEEAESMWTDKFGLKKITPEQLSNYKKVCWQMLTFQGTSMLQKMVPPSEVIQEDVVDASIHGV